VAADQELREWEHAQHQSERGDPPAAGNP
jgi:hypothetical protein